MSIGGDGNKLRELKHKLQGENQGDEDAVVSSDDLKVNEPTENIVYRDEGALEDLPVSLQTSLQLNSEGSFAWDKFLHVRSIKVLLVENDYSTRHVVTALLRNCNYEVTEAENGLQAWKILEDPSIKIDLVLTEVEMPDLSGIDLLQEIMNHETRNNVPVIMMSSNDSMGTVFNYLSKGAADFLVKPIRKNELKNLWQHVWRRCQRISGSGSETGTQTQKSVELEDVENFNNDSGSNGGYDIESMGLNVGDGSDNGSGTQSTWTKQALDMDSPRSAPVEDRVAESPDSTCAQVIHANTEASGDKQAPLNNVKMSGGCKEERDEERKVRDVDFKFNNQVEDPTKNLGRKQKHILEKGSGNLKERTEKVHQDLNSEAPSSTVNCAANLTGSTTNTGIEPSFEHALKRIREENDLGTAVLEDRNVFRRSDSSVFPRYNAFSNANKTPGAKIRSGYPPDSTLDKTKEGSAYDLQSHSKGDHHNQSSNMCQCHCNHHNMQEQQCCQQLELTPGHRDALLEKMAATVPHCAAGSSNVFGGFVEGTGGNYYSANGSASGSNHGSNEPNGSNTAANTGGVNGSGSGDGSGCGSGTRNRVEQNKTSHIEAALTMFRQKRKKRGLRKKARNQSKKRLAEKKPRIRRQVVQKKAKASSSQGTES